MRDHLLLEKKSSVFSQVADAMRLRLPQRAAETALGSRNATVGRYEKMRQALAIPPAEKLYADLSMLSGRNQQKALPARAGRTPFLTPLERIDSAEAFKADMDAMIRRIKAHAGLKTKLESAARGTRGVRPIRLGPGGPPPPKEIGPARGLQAYPASRPVPSGEATLPFGGELSSLEPLTLSNLLYKRGSVTALQVYGVR